MSAKEETLNFNVAVIEKAVGIKFNGSTIEEKEKFVRDYREKNAPLVRKMMDAMQKEYEQRK